VVRKKSTSKSKWLKFLWLTDVDANLWTYSVLILCDCESLEQKWIFVNSFIWGTTTELAVAHSCAKGCMTCAWTCVQFARACSSHSQIVLRFWHVGCVGVDVCVFRIDFSVFALTCLLDVFSGFQNVCKRIGRFAQAYMCSTRQAWWYSDCACTCL